MIETIQNLNYVLAIGGILGTFLTIFIVFDLKGKQLLSHVIREWGLIFAFFVTLASSVLTLVYSEIFGIIPCGLCWLERIALYPQVLILGTAIYLKDRIMPKYGIVLSVFGLLVSLYHHYLQMGGTQFIKCPATGAGADCAKRFFFEFDFMTFPLMSAILFVFLIVLYTYILRTKTT
jgi:disulfide bond formation protein DsbB